MRAYINFPEKMNCQRETELARTGFRTAITVLSGFLSSEGVWFGYKGF